MIKKLHQNKSIKIKVGDYQISDEGINAVLEVLKSNRVTEGPKVAEFEKKWAEFVGTRYSILLNSGTSALIAGLLALKHKYDLPEKTNVITSPLTYIATVNAIVLAGFMPVFVDVDPQTFVLDTKKVEEIAKNDNYVKILLPVHLMGYMNHMDNLIEICDKYDLIIFEDAAQAHGSVYKGRKAGSFGALSAFSFYVAHNIQAGEMGAINTNDLEIYKLIKKIKANGRMCDCKVCLRDQGKCPKLSILRREYPDKDYDPRFLHEIVGYNFKTMDIVAALALVQLEKINKIIEKRQKNVKALNKGLEKFSTVIRTPVFSEKVSYLAYPIVIKKPDLISRREMREKLEEKGIETRTLFGCVPTQQPAYKSLEKEYVKELPIASYVGENGFYIGCHQYLGLDDIDYTIRVFEEILKSVIK